MSGGTAIGRPPRPRHRRKHNGRRGYCVGRSVVPRQDSPEPLREPKPDEYADDTEQHHRRGNCRTVHLRGFFLHHIEQSHQLAQRRIGDARDGAVSAFIPDATPEANPITAAEGVAVDAQGNIYGAVVPTPSLLRYMRK